MTENLHRLKLNIQLKSILQYKAHYKPTSADQSVVQFGQYQKKDII